MKYDNNFFLNTLSKNLNYKIVEFPFCRCIEMDAVSAFRYAVISGSGYLDVSKMEKRLIIRRDFFRIFNQAEQENVQNGIFDKETANFLYTPNIFFEKYPKIIHDNKYIYFLEYNPKEKIGMPPYFPLLDEFSSTIEKYNLDPFNFIITLIPSNNNPKDLESFFEFYISEKYRRMGFLTDTQIPFYYGVGTPDAAAYSSDFLTENLFNRLGIPGASVIDLMCLKYIRQTGNSNSNNKNYVFEMKTGSLDGSQIRKYISKSIFDEAFEVIPHKIEKSNYAGLIRFSSNGDELIEKDLGLPTENKADYMNWLNLYIKCYLITNLDKDKFQKFKNKYSISNIDGLINNIKCFSFDELINMIGGY